MGTFSQFVVVARRNPARNAVLESLNVIKYEIEGVPVEVKWRLCSVDPKGDGPGTVSGGYP